MIANIGLIAALALLIALALRGVNIVFASLLCSLVIVLTNQLPIAESFSQFYAFGPLGAFSFAGKFFILFICGSIFGRVMADSYAAASLANAMATRLGAHRALWIITVACAVLTYGGVIIFIVIFTLYPLSLQLLQSANIPKRLFCGALALGGGTFTLTALPGTPSVQNVIGASALGTDLFAAPGLGILASIIMFGLGIWYLERERVKAAATGEGFEPAATDKMPDHDITGDSYPHWSRSILPLALVLFTILTPRLFGAPMDMAPMDMAPMDMAPMDMAAVASAAVASAAVDSAAVDSAAVDSAAVDSAAVDSAAVASEQANAFQQLMAFAKSQPILWPSFALMLGSLAAVALFPRLHKEPVVALGRGAEDAIMPLINTAAVIGFGGVVVHTSGFGQFTGMMLDSGLPPLASLFVASSMTSALVGSSSGGMQIFMETMAPDYLAMGIAPQTLHRLAAIISGGFDSLPHCGAIVAILTITSQTHKQAYKNMAVVTVLIPVIAALVLLGVVALSG